MARQVDVSQFDQGDVQNVRTWVGFCGDIIAIDGANLDILRRLLERLVVQAERVFPELESGEWVALDATELGEVPLHQEVVDAFVAITGTVLFNGADGPRPTGQILERALDWIAGALLTKGVSDGESDDPATEVAQ